MKDRTLMVYIVDDDAAVRDALAALLGSVGLEARTFASAEAFIEAADAGMRGCLLLDVRMPGMGGLELQPRLREQGVLLPVIFITGHGDVPMAVRAMKSGAADFIEKPFNEQQLLERIQACLKEDEQADAARQAKESARADFERLTARETAVMALIAAGGHSKAIAAELGITERTVDVHRFNIMRKIGVRTLADLLQRWLQAH
jgi:FixJ family two-component response regulator